MSVRKQNINEKTPDWLIEGALEILKGLNYDITKNVHEQFLERHKENLEKKVEKKKKKILKQK